MTNHTATLIIRFKDESNNWKRYPVARAINGRVKHKHALIDGQAVPVTGAFSYAIRIYEDRNTVFIPAGINAADADALRIKVENERTIRTLAGKAGLQIAGDEEPAVKAPAILKSIADYIHEHKKQEHLEAAKKAGEVLDEFAKMMTKKNKTRIEQVTRKDIFDFNDAQREKGNTDRTVANKFSWLSSWLRFAGVDKGVEDPREAGAIIPAPPRFEKTLPTIYTPEHTAVLLGKASPRMKVCILLALKCGLRDQELRHLEYTDFDFAEAVVKVQGKPKWKFKVKTQEQREIPVPLDVLEAVQARKRDMPGHSLVLGTYRQRPNTTLLESLKRLARAAMLNCSVCDGCLSHNECNEFTLHKFRRTYLTTILRQNIDLRTGQSYAGHKDIASTMRYLRPAAAAESQQKINAIKW